MKAWLARHRRRIATLVMLLGLGVVGGQLLRAVPREVVLRYDFGPEHAALQEARIGYKLEGDEVIGVRFRERVLPRTLDHRVELPAGRYELVADLVGPEIRQRVERAFEVPSEGVIRIDLFEPEVFAEARR